MKASLKKFKLFIIAAVIGGYAIISFSFVDNYFEVSKNLDIFATLFRELNIYYVDETNPGDLMKKGIDDMLESLDPYTNYIPESEIEDYRYMTTGQYGGIGALIRQQGDYVVVSEPYEGFPAQKADLRAGDRILKINDIDTKGKKTEDISKFLKGQASTTIKLLIEREGEKKPIEKIISREEIKIKSVSNPDYSEYKEILEGAVILSIDGQKAKDMESVSSYLAKKENQKARYQIMTKNGQMYSIIM